MIHDRDHWNQFLLREPTQVGLFLQSWEWLDFQEKIGRQVHRLSIGDDEGICGTIQYNLPLGKSYLYSPRGPIFHHEIDAPRYHELFYECQDGIRELDKKRQAIFWRFEPMANLAALPRRLGGYGAAAPLEATSLHTRRGRHLIAPAHCVAPIQPKQTLIVELTQGEDRILASMHEKTRYNVRLALKKGVSSQKSVVRDFEYFWELLQETAKRDGFRTHLRGYYEKMLAVCHPDPALAGEGSQTSRQFVNDQFFIRLWLAHQNQDIIASAIVGYFGDTATYLHGASSYKYRSLMAPYAMHWQIMQDAKARGYRWYDFWGIDEKKWPGMTRFKTGFGGKVIDYPGTFDLPFSKFWYRLYRIGRRVL